MDGTVLFVGAAVLLVVIVALCLGRGNGREGFQDANTAAGQVPLPKEGQKTVDKGAVCPVLKDMIDTQLRQRKLFQDLKVDMNTEGIRNLMEMMKLNHSNMVEMGCPEIPSIE